MRNTNCAGTPGIEGKDPAMPSENWNPAMPSLWKEAGLEYKFTSTEGWSLYWENRYEVKGKKGTKAGDGGNGGKRGNPGLPGKILLFGLDQTPDLTIYQKHGKVIDLTKFISSKLHD